MSPLRLRGRSSRHCVVRRLAHEPLGWRPTVLEVTVNRPGMSGDLEPQRGIAVHHSSSLSAIIHGAVVFDCSTETRTET